MTFHSYPPPPGVTVPPATLGDCIRRRVALRAYCRRCKHQDVLYPVTLAEKLGQDFPVDKLAPRLRCTECNGKGMASVYEVGR
jgi:ribosomal protein L44E